MIDKSIKQVERKQGNSYFFSGLMKDRNMFLNMGSSIVNNGTQVRFLEDKWEGDCSFKDRFLSLYAIVR